MNSFFKKVFKSYKLKKVMFTSHWQADPDSIGSCVGMMVLLNSIFPETECSLIFDEMDDPVKKIMKKYDIKHETTGNFEDFDAYFLLDVNNAVLLGKNIKILEYNKPLFIIDHHVVDPNHVCVSLVMDSESFHELDARTNLSNRQGPIDAAEIAGGFPMLISRNGFDRDITFDRFASIGQRFFGCIG